MKLLFPAIAVLLVLTFLTGGGSNDRGPGDVAAQLLALPVLAASLWVLLQAPFDRRLAWPLGVATLIVLTVALQPMLASAGAWQGNATRAALLADLAAAGVDPRHLSWSLTPWATERSLWSLLPALALFTAALTLDERRRRTLVLLVIALVLASLVLGYLQLGAPQDSLLNPFPQWVPALNGVFSNPNHQATAIGVALVLLLAQALQGLRRRHGDDPIAPGRWVALALAGVFLLASLPLTGSRAMVLLAIPALLAVPLLDGSFTRVLRSSRWPRPLVWLGVVAALLVATALGWAGLQWMRVDAMDETRGALTQATAQLGLHLAPWGAGVGSFVPWFEQAASTHFLASEYINHAHNEYVQWWLESGVMGLAALLAALALLAWHVPPSGQGRSADAVAVGSWVAAVLVLAHSAVDYPLRTPSMMAVTAVLAGIAVAASLSRRAAVDARPTPAAALAERARLGR